MPLTATPLPLTGAVSLVLTAPVTYSLVSLTRVDASGAHPVRLLAGQGLVSGSMTVTDAEAALTGSLTYRAVVKPSSGTAVTYTSTVQLRTDRDYITAMVLPATRVAPLLVLGSTTQVRAHATTVHDVIGRPDPLVSIGVQGTRRGTLAILCEDYAQARALEAVLGAGHVVHWRQREHDGLDIVFTPLSVELAPAPAITSPRRWLANVEYVEIAWPTDPLLGSLGWTVATLAAAGLTVAEVPTRYATVTALAVGPLP